MKVLVTGAAGFIGFHYVNKMLGLGYDVVGLDNINDYYKVGLKYDRLKEKGIYQQDIGYNRLVQSEKHERYRFIKLGLEDEVSLLKLFANERFDYVVHLAAQAGVRYSIEKPHAYISSNIVGFANLLEVCRHFPVKHLVFASSSSVYGLNQNVPFSTKDQVVHPISLYAASKKSNELMAHCYSHLYKIPTTGLRFFTVYGPWGRPDMAYFLFTEAILAGKPIKIFNNGNLSRDFTFVGDIVEGMQKVMHTAPEGNGDWDPTNPDPASSPAPYKIYNIGNRKPVNLLEFIETIEKELGQEAQKEMLPMQPGDVQTTFADVSGLQEAIGYHPNTTLAEGIRQFVEWHQAYFKYRLKN